jgi:phenylacetate-CoA ligase
MNARIAGLLLDGAYSLLGEQVRNHLRELERTQWLPRPELDALRVRRLREVFERASRSSPWYQRAFEQADLRPADVVGLDALLRLPVLSKDDIRAHGADLAGSGPRGRTEMRKTSGSTGQPLALAKSRYTTGAMNAVMWRNYGWFGIRMGDRQGRIWAGAPTPLTRIKTRTSDFLQNRVRMSSFAMGPTQFDRFIAELLAFRPRYLYGYGQALYRLAEYADAHGKGLGRLGLAAVISTAERISDTQREVMTRAFETFVVNEYGCTEAGIIAMHCPEGALHLMDDALIVEVVRDGVPVKPGEEGEILVTELYGALAPLIRYRIGDRAVVSNAPCACGRSLLALERLIGRTTELIRCPDGTLVDPDLFHPILKSRPEMYAAIRQWRVAEEAPGRARFTLCTAGAQKRPDIEAFLAERIGALTNGRLQLVFAYEEWLAPNATGKTL